MTVTTLWYDHIDNYFTNDEGRIIYDIFKYMTPNKLLLIKKNPGYYYIYPKIYDTVYEIYIPFEDEEEWGWS